MATHTTMDYTRIFENAQNILNAAPKELKEGGASFMAAAANLAQALTLHQDEIKPLSQLCVNMRNGICIDAAQANEMVDMCSHAIVAENKTEILTSLTNKAVCNQAVVKQMEEAMRSTANKFLGIGAISSFFFIVVEAVRLWNLWEAIKDARNIAESSSKERVKISQTLKKILDEINALNLFVRDIISGKSEEIIRVRAMRQIDRIRRMLDGAERDIRELEIVVDRMKVRLLDARHSGKISAVTNVVSGGTTAVSALLFASLANPWLVGLNAVLGVTNGLIFIGNVAACVISKEDLKRLEEELRAIDVLKKYRQELEDTLHSKAEELWNLLEDRV